MAPVSAGTITFTLAGPFPTRADAEDYLRSLEPHVRCRFHVAEGWPGRWFVRESV